jgi:dTDP-4-amino-4,6-dideoxygalactose transaminase
MPGYEVFGEEEKKEIMDVLDTGVLFRYEFLDQRRGVFKVRQFEEAFASYCGARHAQAVTSGTAALKVALTALGVGPGDEVITQGFTFVATWEAILEVGAVPVFTEVDQTLNMDPADLRKKITARTKCIVPVHMLGAQARIEEIGHRRSSMRLPVIEDTAQATGGRHRRTSSWHLRRHRHLLLRRGQNHDHRRRRHDASPDDAVTSGNGCPSTRITAMTIESIPAVAGARAGPSSASTIA